MRSYLVGIKGTGMAHLAVLLKAMGHTVRGCDSAERFVTDSTLEAHGIDVDHGFAGDLLPDGLDLVIHSSAYGADVPIIREAMRREVEVVDYPAFVARLTRAQESWAVVGTHGKTTTVSVATHLLSNGSRGRFPFYALYGSREQTVDRVPYWGSQVALFEGCEYQDHFLSYHLRGMLITTIDWDHPDYFGDIEAVSESFEALALRIPRHGILIYNSDDAMVRRLIAVVETKRADLTIIGYGFTADGLFGIEKRAVGEYAFTGFEDLVFTLVVDAPALVGDHLGALVLATSMVLDQDPPTLYLDDSALVSEEVLPTVVANLARHLTTFGGAEGRLEVMGEEGGVTYLDDYAHHPREIEVLLCEVTRRYRDRAKVVLFCPHTASRTRALFDHFVTALSDIEYLVIQATYASARGDRGGEDPAYALYERLATIRPGRVRYARTDDEAIAVACSWLHEGAVCITMGAGNNRQLAGRIAQMRRSKM
ncbi:MAG: Mur ligase domain-containing protein [Sphaerochaeta sp.]|nr:Mur ligase domain-containing protein [Sphaerochaeta sp.]